MAGKQAFLQGTYENLFEMCDFYATWDAEAFKKKQKEMQY